MPYKNKEDRKKCSRRHYERHREQVKQGTKLRREAARAYIRSTKENKPCTMCNVRYPWYKLDYHHKPGTVKLYIISEMPTKNSSLKAIKAEIEKCILTCANCHREHTFNGGKP